ncbi:MAG TPA: phosphomannomutase/phosphoglucomutase, partial [Noviherbaspirillum sp.]|nr:phosphomannomutase/phosphoglucomutase [Noviherbaspirillum sp.]
MLTLSPDIFKAYDIRGIVGKTLDIGVARHIGQAFGTAVRIKDEQTVVIGRDGRL